MPELFNALELVGPFFSAMVPVIAPALGIVVADHPFTLHNVDEGVLALLTFMWVE